ncbi:predicted protein [Verticillium alfalfae VaMs.102]|uniref:Predicted protein n=1 Tax=Verticillium alfalfae (strain VaMs.102 / ATCC MYA-4576 / FGSC 10136) TaxID=526221 RepID=C9SHU9_VERA1|nr:predicted protein [Verticillium alfalfae VaMs.102]EEY18522.1 predicted protein [Verticillium alfalfae VaMs.102]
MLFRAAMPFSIPPPPATSRGRGNAFPRRIPAQAWTLLSGRKESVKKPTHRTFSTRPHLASRADDQGEKPPLMTQQSHEAILQNPRRTSSIPACLGRATSCSGLHDKARSR